MKNGDAFGDYKVIDLAGSGGMATVYKIEHSITKRVEAMKLLPIGVTSESEQVQRFEREIQVQARLHHPNIVAVYNAVRDGRSIALVMEYVEGECLQSTLERGRLPVHTSVDYAGQVLDALAYAHELGVVHRDVSPANIIITRDGTAKLTDFGLARAANDLKLTTTGVAMGSPWYMSPEQVRAVGELDARTDIYTMGAVLFEMLTGGKLFDADGSFAIMRAQMEAVPQPPSAYNPEVPTALDEVIAKALAKDPAARFQSAGEFHLALEASVGRMPSGATTNGKAASAPAKPYPARLAVFRPAWSWGWRVRTSRAGALLVLAPAVFVALLIGLELRRKAEPVTAPAPVTRETVVSKPEAVPPAAEAVVDKPADEPVRPGVVAVVEKPEVPVAAAKAAPRPAVSFPRSARRTRKSDQTVASPAGGVVAEQPAVTPTPNPPVREPVTSTETIALKPEVVEAPATPLVPVESKTFTEREASTETSEEGKPQKTSNRFVRALGKLNLFRKRAKNDSADPAAASAKKD
jgi:serine/threonine-protein kinase